MSDLLRAIVNDEPDKVRILLESGENPNQVGAGGQVPLCWAIDAESAYYEEDAEARTTETEKYPPNSHLTELLLEAGANPNILDDQGRTPMDHAIGPKDLGFVRHPKAVELLRNYGGKSAADL